VLAIALCILAFVACYLAGRHSLGRGLVMLFVFGYAYGILRANLPTTFSHFIFDAGLLGLYLSSGWQTTDAAAKRRSQPVLMWTVVLLVWPILIVVLPFQPLLVSLVGLRGNIFFIPLLLLGSRLKGKDLVELSVGLAILDLVALGFAGAEYFLGVPRFFPLSPVTQIMYASADVAGGFLRIPATFTSAHAFGGTIIGTIPFLIGLWTGGEKRIYRFLGLIAIPAALLGMLMSATRTNFVFGCAMVVFVIFATRMKVKQRIFFLIIIGALAVTAMSNVRFQRFKTLEDGDYISERVAGSVNRGFWEILVEYPMGNGLGGGGTSIPYFLEGQVRNPIGMENEYARILAEQGVIGLLLWLSLLGWFLFRGRLSLAGGPWATTRKLMWWLVAIDFGTAWIGNGLLTSIPGTVLLLIGMGWTVVAPEATQAQRSVAPNRERRPVQSSGRTYVPAVR
jgi:hypothetical protein